jgi:hypothetical protein
MGEVVSIFADGQLHRQFLNRITRIDLDYINGNLYLKLTTTGDLHPEWIRSHVIFRFVVNNGEKVVTGRSSGGTSFSNDEDNIRHVGIDQDGRVEPLDEWTELEIILVAGGEEKSFTATKRSKEGTTPESDIGSIS